MRREKGSKKKIKEIYIKKTCEGRMEGRKK